MDKPVLWSLRLGYDAKNADRIGKNGIRKFISDSIAAEYNNSLPEFLQEYPKTPQEVNLANKNYRSLSEDEKLAKLKKNQRANALFNAWWIDKMVNSPLPLREKMACLLHNHFVVNAKKVKPHYWIYKHNALLRENAFGNLRALTKQAIKTNAMLLYLDNHTNKKGKINENLSRELLELFTLGIGNYNEQDIYNGAKALAGLGYGDEQGKYYPAFENNETLTYLGKKGNFKADDIIDIIFEQPAAPYLFTRKILSWFIYDNPPEELVKYYGDYFRQQDFEIEPLLLKIFTEEFEKDTAGAKIKDPLVYSIQLLNEVGMEKPNALLINTFTSSQGMPLYGQPNVKGWNGGYSWLTSQLYLRRNQIADRLCKGLNFPLVTLNHFEQSAIAGYNNKAEYDILLKWDRKSRGNKKIIDDFKERLLFTADAEMQQNLENLLKYDFDPKSPGAEQNVLRLFNYIIKTPEFQLV